MIVLVLAVTWQDIAFMLTILGAAGMISGLLNRNQVVLLAGQVATILAAALGAVMNALDGSLVYAALDAAVVAVFLVLAMVRMRRSSRQV